MRISIIGQAAFGEAVFRRLIDEGHELVCVSAPAPGDGRADPLWTAGAAAGMPVIGTAALKGPEGMAEWGGFPADLCVMAFVTEILPQSLFSLPRLGTIQYHPSLLPLHRGSSAMNWALINQDQETGLTIFWPDQGIDTGPVLLQRRVTIGPEDTVGSLYFNALFGQGVDALAESIALISAGNAPRVEQDHSLATYEPPCEAEHGQIGWHEPAGRLHALIRGCNPQPGAWTQFKGTRLKLFDCRLSETPEPGFPGQVLRIDGDGFDVRLNGGVLRVLRVQPEGQNKMAAGEWAAAVGLKKGFRFR